MEIIRKFFSFIAEVIKEKKMLMELAKNDFRAKHTNSLLGIIWAFALPLIIILVLWFVFQVGFRSAPVENMPFILWYIPAFLSWNFFTDAFSSASGCLNEYYYLVKNMKFRVGVLPIVKILSSSFVHFFFIAFIFFMYFAYGWYPRINNIQVVYYYISLLIYLVGLTWLSSALAIFSKDVLNVISLIIQVGFWATPLVWDPSTLPVEVLRVVQINPMYYICNGYRETFCTDIWFWEHPYLTMYFWGFTFVQLVVGAYTFYKLKPQFADML